MRLFELDLNNLIPTVDAQTVDASAQPTFGTLNIGNGSTSLPTVKLVATTNNVAIGSTFDVEVEITTGTGVNISKYEIVIDYDINHLAVVDAEPSISGTQIKHLDTVFQVSSGDNTVQTTTGRITLIASTPGNVGVELNRKVARITFQAQSQGTTDLKFFRSGLAGTKLLNTIGTSLDISTQDLLNINITSSAQTTSTLTTSSTTTSVSSTTSTFTSFPTIPDTGIVEDFASNFPVALGFLLIIVGILLSRYRNSISKK